MRLSEFEIAHSAFVDDHLSRRTGERRDRLRRGHAHGEQLFLKNVWWPLMGSFDGLHPEFEVLDWRRRSYFADFAFLPESLTWIIEVKGFEAHITNMDRTKYCNDCNRELFLQAMGFRVLSFAYDDVALRPELCINMLQMLLGRYQPQIVKAERLVLAEQEVIRLAIFLARPIRPIDALAPRAAPRARCESTHFGVNYRTAIGWLRELCRKGWLKPIMSGKQTRIENYVLNKDPIDLIGRRWSV